MNKIILYATVVLFCAGCSKDESGLTERYKKPVSPEFFVSELTTPFTGALSVYPCNANTSVFFGNYKTGLPIITSQFGYYQIENGAIDVGNSIPLLLPVGTYNLVYWGEIPFSGPGKDPSGLLYPNPVVGDDLDKQYLSLLPYRTGGTLYRPSPNLSFAVKETGIGSDKIAAVLERAVAGLQITLRNDDGSALNESIESLELQVHDIPKQLNLFSAAASGPTVTVLLPLTISADRMQAQNPTGMLFPSVVAPRVSIVITLANGNVRTYDTTLSNTLKANNKLSLSVNLGKILENPTPGNGFEIKNWTESNETINTGNIQ